MPNLHILFIFIVSMMGNKRTACVGCRQRQNRKSDELPQHRIKHLNLVGFVWSKQHKNKAHVDVIAADLATQIESQILASSQVLSRSRRAKTSCTEIVYKKVKADGLGLGLGLTSGSTCTVCPSSRQKDTTDCCNLVSR